MYTPNDELTSSIPTQIKEESSTQWESTLVIGRQTTRNLTTSKTSTDISMNQRVTREVFTSSQTSDVKREDEYITANNEVKARKMGTCYVMS